MTPERYRRIRSVLDRRQPDLTVLMDNVHKPHNLSAVARTCDAVGIGEIHAVTGGAAGRGGPGLWHKGASGAERWLERHAHPSVDAAYAALRARGFRVVVAEPDPAAADYRACDFTVPTALVLGAELAGLSAAARERADARIRIPVEGMVESLNVSVAAAIVLFEARRQREAAGLYAARRLDEATYRRRLFEWCHPRVAACCRANRLAYPRLDAAGEIAEPLARGAAPVPPAAAEAPGG